MPNPHQRAMHEARMLEIQEDLKKDAIYILRTKGFFLLFEFVTFDYGVGMDSLCGVPYCCPGPSLQVDSFLELPEELEGYMEFEQYKKMCDEVSFIC